MKFLRQRRVNECGPVAIANLLKCLGRKIQRKDLPAIERQCEYHPQDGTRLNAISKALREHGVKFSKRNKLTIKLVEKSLEDNKVILAVSYIKEVSEHHAYLIVGKRPNGWFEVVNLFHNKTTDIISPAHLAEVLKAKDGSEGWIVAKVPN